MIVRMNKVVLLCTAGSRDRTLDALRELGVLHLVPVQPPAGEDIDRARERVFRVRHALDVLPKHPRAVPSGRDAEAVVKEVWDLLHQRREEEIALDQLDRERQRVEPFGSFDPAALRRLEQRNIMVRLCAVPRRQSVEIPEGAVKVALREDKTMSYFALISRGEAKPGVPEVRLPELSLADLRKRIVEKKEAVQAITRRFVEFAGDRPVVERLAAQVDEQVRFLEAREGMGAMHPVAYLSGFCPADTVELVRRAGVENGWGIVISEPAQDDHVPTLLRNPSWVTPIKPLLEFIGILPGYKEVDLSGAILFFFSLFFAIIVGDAGYGLLFLGFSLWGRRRFPHLPAPLFQFLNVMSVCTLVWGVLTGQYFGIGNAATQEPPTLLPPFVPWLTSEYNVKLLCFVIGVTQLSLAHIWNIWRLRKSSRCLAQIGWLFITWTMFFFACAMVLNFPFQNYVRCVDILNNPFPAFMGPVFLAGVALVVLFMTPLRSLKDNWFDHVMLPLNLVSNFVDMVSYIRLFAVGAASYAVAHSFNTMLAPMMSHGLTALLAAIFLFLAHALNILLALMGVMVHGVRLNTLEFSNHIGMQWSGIPYEPFKRSGREEVV